MFFLSLWGALGLESISSLVLPKVDKNNSNARKLFFKKFFYQEGVAKLGSNGTLGPIFSRLTLILT